MLSLTLVARVNPLTSAHERAWTLADDMASWPDIARVLADEGYSAAIIKKIGKDRDFKGEITRRLLAAEQRRLAANAPPCQTWRIEEPKACVKLKAFAS